MPRAAHPQNTPGQRRRMWRYRQHESDQMYEAEMRSYIAAEVSRGLSFKEIASILQVQPRTVRAYLTRSVQRVNELEAAGENVSQAMPRSPTDLAVLPHRVSRGTGAGPHVRGSPKAPQFSAPGLIDLKRKVWELRKRQLPFDEIAELAGITEQEARNIVKERLANLETIELQSAESARGLMVAQIDDMIRAVTPHAVGTNLLGELSPVDYKAVAQMLNLLNAKADLLGLKAATKVDMTIALRQFAEENQYDYQEVEEVAAEVLSAMSQRRVR